MAEAPLNAESPSVSSYLGILQGVVGRMAANSTSCKTWCVTLVSAIAVVVADKNKPSLVWISIIPTALFFILDGYYLALEREFRAKYNDFVLRLHTGIATIEDAFIVAPRKGVRLGSWDMLNASGSISVWPFYSLLAVMMAAVRYWVL